MPQQTAWTYCLAGAQMPLSHPVTDASLVWPHRGADFHTAHGRDVTALEAAGARVVRFSPLHAGCHGVLLGGATPLTPHTAALLSANSRMAAALRAFAAAGGAVLAQSTGLAYLSSCVATGPTTSDQLPMGARF